MIHKYKWLILSGAVVIFFILSPFTFAQVATEKVEVTVSRDSVAPQDDSVIKTEMTLPAIKFKVMPEKIVAGKDNVFIEISTQNIQTHELTEGAYMDVTFDYPKKTRFIPVSENALGETKFFSSEFTSKQGVVLLENLVFPIRGTYLLNVKARPIDGRSFEPITASLELKVSPGFFPSSLMFLAFCIAIIAGIATRNFKKRT